MTPLRPASLAEFELFCHRAHPGQLIEPPPGWTIQHIMEAFPEGLPGGIARLAAPTRADDRPPEPERPVPRPHRVEVTLSPEELETLTALAKLEFRSLAGTIRLAVAERLREARGLASPPEAEK